MRCKICDQALGWLSRLALAPLAALGVQFAADDTLRGAPFITFFQAVLLVAFLGGPLPAAFATLLSTVLAAFFMFDRRIHFPLDRLAGSAFVLYFDFFWVDLARSHIAFDSLQTYKGDRRVKYDECGVGKSRSRAHARTCLRQRRAEGGNRDSPGGRDARKASPKNGGDRPVHGEDRARLQ